MRKLVLSLSVVILGLLSLTTLSQAAMKMGKTIHEEKVNVTFQFDLIDLKGQVVGQTHHLMVYLKDSAGKPITKAKVKYKIIAPDEEGQVAKPMAMGDGFGADINLAQSGEYEIICQATVGKTKITTRFKYAIKK